MVDVKAKQKILSSDEDNNSDMRDHFDLNPIKDDTKKVPS